MDKKITDDFCGANPLLIARVIMRKGTRGYGDMRDHPYRERLYKKKHPVLSKIFSVSGDPILTGFATEWKPAMVRLIGADGQLIGGWYCKSNAEAQRAKELTEEKLNEFLKSLQIHK